MSSCHVFSGHDAGIWFMLSEPVRVRRLKSLPSDFQATANCTGMRISSNLPEKMPNVIISSVYCIQFSLLFLFRLCMCIQNTTTHFLYNICHGGMFMRFV